MKFGYQTNTWGGIVGHPGGVTSVKELYYFANSSTEEALKNIAAHWLSSGTVRSFLETASAQIKSQFLL
ncbi:hypothetical protein PH210_29620 [Paenibacillus sp. BSR1-1]|uniref:hypothetical protein n=1 Tax=Paenibacillus sp. BSR1-1 TaxID=3020845 RepID=UPI0025AF583C|nr:hypothetical protein [Paenibacillus sp. BSR1-1]MDN3020276.1 hypothetical protein [Paenibacillus sp. BSR1-1]